MEHHRSKFNFSIRSLVFLTIALSIPASPVLSQKDKDIEVRISTDFALEDMRIDLSGGCTVVSVSYKGLLKSTGPTTKEFSDPCPGTMTTQFIHGSDGPQLRVTISGDCHCKCPRGAYADPNTKLTEFGVVANIQFSLVPEVKGDVIL